MLRRVVHLVTYDLRSLRWPLFVWGLALGCQAAVLLLGPDRLGADPRLTLNYDIAVLIVRLMLTAVLAAVLIQSDALVGTTAFWRTRPIPRWALLTSKMASAVGLLVIAPGLLILGVLLLLGLPAASALDGAIVVAAEQAFLLILALAMAAVTANLAHFVIAGMASFTLVLLAMALLPALIMTWPQLRPVVLSWGRTFFITAAAVGAGVGVAHQFLTLRTNRSAALVGLGLLVATAGGAMWRPAPEAPPAGAVDPSVLAATDVRVELLQVGWANLNRVRGLFASVHLSGEPDAILLRPAAIDVALTIGDRPPVRWKRGFVSGLVNAPTRPGARSQPYRSVGAALGGVDLGLPRNVMDQQYRLGLMEIGEDTSDLLRDSPGTFEAILTLRAFRYTVTARTPVTPGGVLRMPGRRATITAIGPPQPVLGIERSSEGLNLILRDTDVTIPWGFSFAAPPSYYVLSNASRRQAVFATPHTQKTFRATIGLLQMPPRVRTGSLQLEYDPAQSDATFAVDDEWIRGADLLRLEPEDLGVVTRPARIDGLKGPGLKPEI